MKRLKAEWIPHMEAYRLYDPENPLHYCTTVAYVEDLEKAISLGNKNPFFYSELGFAYELVGDLKKSLAAFELADSTIDELGLGSTTYNYNNIHNYFSVYINNAKHAMYESEGEH